jgi:hypothetical protein
MRLAVVETQLAWIVYIIGAVVSEYSPSIILYSTGSDDTSEYDSLLAVDGIELVQVGKEKWKERERGKRKGKER